MPKDNFVQRKKSVMLKQDKSSKGNWDDKIKKLCEKINKKENYYTTSSCAGRVLLMVDSDKKQKNLFLKIYHDLIGFWELKRDLGVAIKKRNVKFKQEPCILHVACRTMKDAYAIYKKAKEAGWKRSGIIATGKRYVVEMNSTEKLEFPVICRGKILVDDSFLKVVVKKTNKNLKKSWGKIEKLRKLV